MLQLPDKFRALGETQSAARLGVKVEHFGQDGLALGYGRIESSQITEGIRRLRRAITNHHIV